MPTNVISEPRNEGAKAAIDADELERGI